MNGRSSVLPWLLVCGALQGLAQDPLHRRYGTADGLPSNTVYCVAQDDEGFIWFGTDAGAARFDGRNFVHYGLDDGLTDTEVLRIVSDSKKRLWFLTLNGRLCYLENGVMHNAKTDTELARFVARDGWQSLVEDRDGMLWFGGIRNDVLRLDLEGDEDSLFRIEGLISTILNEHGAIRLSVSNCIYDYETGTWRRLVEDPTDEAHVNGLVLPGVRPGDPALLVSPQGLMAFREDEWQLLDPVLHFDAATHQRAWSDALGGRWVRRWHGGIEYYPTHQTAGIRSPILFPQHMVTNAMIDREGNYWFTTLRSGVIRCTHEQMASASYRVSDTSGSSAVLCLMRDARGRVWLGTSGGAIHTFDNAGLSANLGASDVPLGRIMGFCEDHEHRVWAATDSRLLVFANGGEGPPRAVPSRSSGDDLLGGAKAVEASSSGRVWSSYTGLYRTELIDGVHIRRPLAETQHVGRVMTMHEDKGGLLWFPTGNELWSYSKGQCVRHDAVSNWTGLRITDIQAWRGDTLLLGTVGGGIVFVLKGVPVRHLTTKEGLVSDVINRIRLAEDTLVLSTDKGVSLLLQSPGRVRWQMTLDRSSGLIADEVNDALLSDGRVLIAGEEGLAVFPIQRTTRSTRAPQVYFSTVALNDSVIRPTSTVTMLEGGDRLHMAFQAMTFADPERVNYEYRLSTSDPWSIATDGTVDLASLAPGAYRFEGRARKVDSDWSRTLTLAITVQPPWWASDLAKVSLLLGGVALLLFAVFFWSRRKFREKLEQVRQHAALNEERRRIAADVHDDLGADLSRVLMHARLLESGSSGPHDGPVSKGIVATIDKIDEIIWSLDPKRDTLQSTVHFIEQQAREMAEAHGLKFRTQVDMPEEEVHFAANKRRELMLIAREAMRNVVEHARATTLRVDWRCGAERITLAVQDDGVGMPAITNGVQRHGLANMRERAERLGGTLTILSVEPSGTRVEVNVSFA